MTIGELLDYIEKCEVDREVEIKLNFKRDEVWTLEDARDCKVEIEYLTQSEAEPKYVDSKNVKSCNFIIEGGY